ncbi:MAG: FMN-binding protein [Candidatus Marinimicrobia bacterium]|nr:FMN-binding protein [Candidatus Neomarinimicrobiota bacterium]
MNRKVLLLVMIAGLVFLNSCKLKEYKEKVENTVISDIDLSNIRDGEFEGFYDCYLVKAKVKVRVKDNAITGIELIEHENGKGKKGELVVPAVLEKQSLMVDTITGATASSKVILKAIELALTGAASESN